MRSSSAIRRSIHGRSSTDRGGRLALGDATRQHDLDPVRLVDAHAHAARPVGAPDAVGDVAFCTSHRDEGTLAAGWSVGMWSFHAASSRRSRCSSTACCSRPGEDYEVDDGQLLFTRPLVQEGRLGFWRWFWGAWGIGTYKPNHTVDVRYERDGRKLVAHALRALPPERA